MNNEYNICLESFISPIPNSSAHIKSYSKVLSYISNNFTNKEYLISENLNSKLIYDYNDNYNEFSKTIFINEFIEICKEFKEIILSENETFNEEYNDENFDYNGFIKSDYVIHEHNSHVLHWDLRFKTQFKTKAYSFVLLKCKMPETNDEKLLVKRQPMHPPKWVDLDHTAIKEGYGKGSIKTIDRGIIYFKIKQKKDKESFTFYLKGNKYEGAYHLIQLNYTHYYLFKAKNSILTNKEDRAKEWITYAREFLNYINKTLIAKFNIDSHEISSPEDIDKDKLYGEIEYNRMINNLAENSKLICIPSIEYMMQIRNNELNDIKSKEAYINNIEDIMRLFILRKNIAPQFFKWLEKKTNKKDILAQIYDKIREIQYNDNELNQIKNRDPALYPREKIYRMFADIYLGHKYYKQFDFERYLISLLKNKNLMKE